MRKTAVTGIAKAHHIRLGTLSKIKGYILPLTLLIFAGLMLAFPSHYLDSARKGLAVFSSSVLPAIFPFVFLSGLMSRTSIIDDISKAFEKPVRALFGVSRKGAFVLFSSLICGYPAGAVTIQQLYTDGKISESEAKSYIPISSTASPIFVIATIGGAIFGDMTIGVVILLSHYIGTLLNGVLWRFVLKTRERRNEPIKNANTPISEAQKPIAHTRIRICDNNKENVVGDAMVRATTSMLAVGGYFVLFGMVVDTLHLLPFFDTLPIEVRSILSAVIEMSRGAVEARGVSPMWLSVGLSAFAITFGGASVGLQNYHYLSQCNCTLRDVILPKISQGIFAFFMGVIFSIIFFNIFGIKG